MSISKRTLQSLKRQLYKINPHHTVWVQFNPALSRPIRRQRYAQIRRSINRVAELHALIVRVSTLGPLTPDPFSWRPPASCGASAASSAPLGSRAQGAWSCNTQDVPLISGAVLPQHIHLGPTPRFYGAYFYIDL